MPRHQSKTSRIVSPDANICIPYSLCIDQFNKLGRNMPYPEICARLDSYRDAGILKICAAVVYETKHYFNNTQDKSKNGIFNVLTRVMNGINMSKPRKEKLIRQCQKRFNKFLDGCYIENQKDNRPRVEKMYGGIWDPKNPHPNLGEWSRIKGKPVSEGPPTGCDIMILSTMVHLQGRYDHVLFLTNDHDFLCFKDVISREFGIELESIWPGKSR